MQVIKQWKVRIVEGMEGRSKKYVTLGRLRTPTWVFVCLGIVLSMIFSFLANGAMKEVLALHGDSEQHSVVIITCNYHWLGVLMAVYGIDLIAVMSGAIIRLKLLRDEEGNSSKAAVSCAA